MNKALSDSSAALVNYQVDYGGRFQRTFQISVDGVLEDLTYYDEVGFEVEYPKTCKTLKSWTLTGNEFTEVSTGIVSIDELHELERGVYDCFFYATDGNGKTRKYTRGNFIVV